MRFEYFKLAAACLIVAAVSTAFGSEMKVAVPDTTGATGTIQEVIVQASGGPDLAAGRLVLTYAPDVLEVDTVNNGDALNAGNAQAGFTVNEPGRLTMNFISTEGVSGAGELFRVRFNVHGPSGAVSELALTKVLAWRAADDVDVLSTVTNGSFAVHSGLPLPLPWLLAIVAGACVLLLLILRPRRRPVPAGAGPSASHSVCRKCGQSNDQESHFCNKCGTPLKGNP